MIVYKYRNPDLGGRITVTEHVLKDTAYVDVTNHGVSIPQDDAPAVALAILEASGWGVEDADEIAGEAVAVLRNAVVAQQKAKALAEDAANLDAEALALRNASLGVDADTLVGAHQDHWRKIAMKAREIYAPKEKA